MLNGLKPDPNSIVHTGIHPGLNLQHVIFNFWLSVSNPMCELTPMESLIQPETGIIIYRWMASLGTAILLPKQNVPIWLEGLWKHEPVFPDNSYLILEMTHIDHQTLPLMTAWFAPFDSKTNPATVELKSDQYLIEVRSPYDENRSVCGHVRMRKVKWHRKQTDSGIEYRF